MISTTDPESHPLVNPGADGAYSQPVPLQTEQEQRPSNGAVIAVREKEINDIAQGIGELTNIFWELQSIIIDQRTVLNLQQNIERMLVDANGASKELAVARGWHQNTTKRKIMLLLILLAVSMSVVLLVWAKGQWKGSFEKVSPPAQVQSSCQATANYPGWEKLKHAFIL
jgi:syntaxin 16